MFTNIAYAASPISSDNTGSAPITLLQLTGTLSASSDSTTFILTTEKAIAYSLTGNIAGIDTYLGQKIIVKGYILYPDPRIMSPVNINPTFFVLQYFPLTPTPTATVPITIKVTGALSLSNQALYKYALTDENNVRYLLIGKTDGMDKYINKKVVVVGYLQSSIQPASGILVPPITPVIVVVDFSPVLESTSTPAPTVTNTIAPNPTPTPPILVKLTGILSLSNQAAYKFALTVENNIKYLLTGKTDGMNNYINKKIVILGYFQPAAPIAIGSTILSPSMLVFVVVDYSPVPEGTPTPTATSTASPKPTPTPPILVKYTGTLSLSGQTTYKYALITENNVKYLLTGKTDGMDNYINKKVLVSGYFQSTPPVSTNIAILPPSMLVFVVVEYSPLPEVTPAPIPTAAPPILVNITGTLSLSNQTNYKYVLTTDGNIKYLLTGKIDGIDKYINQKLIVTGKLSVSNSSALTVTNSYIFEVTSYCPLPIVSPTANPLSLPPNTIK